MDEFIIDIGLCDDTEQSVNGHSDNFSHVLSHVLYGSSKEHVCQECLTLNITWDTILTNYILNGSTRDRFYHLAILNNKYDNISIENIRKIIDILKEGYIAMFDSSLPFSTHNVHICRFFFESATRIGEFREKLMEYCTKSVQNFTREDKQHLIDVLPRCDLKDMVLKDLRTIDTPLTSKTREILYYQDTQSAHLVNIVTNDGKPLKDRSLEFDIFVNELPEDIKCMKAIEDIRINNSEQINLRSTFVHVIDTIKTLSNSVKYDVMKRLKEELQEMTNTCATGMNVRLVNILTGYTENIKLALPFEDELKGAVFARMNKKLEVMPEAFKNMYVINMLDDVKVAEYVLFKERVKTEIYQELIKEYKSCPGFDDTLFNSTFSEACRFI